MKSNIKKKSMAISFIIAVNDDDVFNKNIMSSPELMKNERNEILVMRRYKSAAMAYNKGIAKAANEIIVCVHQDVYLPNGWIEKLYQIINSIDEHDPSWGVLGCFGVNMKGEMVGHVYSNGLQSELGCDMEPVMAQSLDELILIFKKSSKLTFDPFLPNYHMYGADICVRAKIMGYSNYIIGNFCVHNSVSIKKFKKDFWESVSHFKRQYLEYLPIKTTCTVVYKSHIKMKLNILTSNYSFFKRQCKNQINIFLKRKNNSRYITVRLQSPEAIKPNNY